MSVLLVPFCAGLVDGGMEVEAYGKYKIVGHCLGYNESRRLGCAVLSALWLWLAVNICVIKRRAARDMNGVRLLALYWQR